MKNLSSCKKSKHYSPEERAKYISLYEASNLSRAKFCEEHNLRSSTFHTWLSKMKHDLSATSKLKQNNFKTLKLVEKNNPSNMSLPNKSKLNIKIELGSIFLIEYSKGGL